jgi:hypothetical protein
MKSLLTMAPALAIALALSLLAGCAAQHGPQPAGEAVPDTTALGNAGSPAEGAAIAESLGYHGPSRPRATLQP